MILEACESTACGLIGFYESYREVSWKEILTQADKSIDVMVYYWDNWVNEHEDSLLKFLSKPGTKLRFIFADGNQPAIVSEIRRLFPSYSEEQLREKIRASYSDLSERLENLNLPLDRIEIYKVPRLVNYALQCIDEKLMILSVFEMSQQDNVDSPAVLIDLENSPQLKLFYQHELLGAIPDSKGL